MEADKYPERSGYAINYRAGNRQSQQIRGVVRTELLKKYSSSSIDFSGLDNYREISWQRQLHLFEVPFYYIEYGIAQLGAFAIYQNYKTNPKAAVEKFDQFKRLGNSKPLKELYEAALAVNDDYAPALNNLAYLQMDVLGDHKEALQLAVRAFRAMPEDPAVLDTLGYALLKNGQADKAVTFLEKAARLRPNDATIKTHLDQARKAAGKTAG